MSQHLHSDFKIRLPDELKEKIRHSANELNRSMTADIVARLEQSFENDKNLSDDEKADYEELKQELKKDMKLITKELSSLIDKFTEYKEGKSP